VTAPIVNDGTSLRRRGQLFVALAAVAWSTAGVLQRQLSVGTSTQLAWRAVFAAIALAGFVAIRNRSRAPAAIRSIGIAGVGVAVCLAVASGSFIVALNHASVANVLFLQAGAPVAAALLAWIALGESISVRALVAMGVAMLGVVLMVGGPGSGGAVGIAASLVMTLAFAVGIVITRFRREVSMAPAVCLSQVLLVLAVGPFGQLGSATAHDLGFLALMGVGQMGLGLAFMTVGARLIPAAEAALITLLEVVLGPIWVWMALGERPALIAVVGGLVVILAVVVQTTESMPVRTVQRRATAPDAAG
jgi:drug/metabolite transporter (DMT)-like permease